MASWVVTDAGLFIAIVLNEPLAEKAKALIQYWDTHQVELAAPSLFRYEVAAVMRKSVNRGLLSADEGRKSCNFLLNYPLQIMMNNQLLQRGYDLAEQFKQPTAYDAQYLAVAERLGSEFWTTDERFFNTLRDTLSWVKWLGHYQP